ncbi:rRNA (cytosine-C5-)-methyltransferase RCM1 [Sporobolomyces salmoneus]|uniref:rRNA (cytosine-C5-)-methyltransferase RCM1 n=1 Tax=Sporobolomyces salmoneus TaxID=183962 RepID=UPI00316EC3B1
MDFYHRTALILDSLDNKKGSVKGLCMSEAKKSKKPGEGARFLGVVINVLKYRPHLLHLLQATKLMQQEPTLFVPPSSTLAVSNAIKSGSASSATKALKSVDKDSNGNNGKNKWVKKVKEAPTPENLAQVMVHDLLFAKRGLSLAKEHKLRKKLEKYKPALDKENEKEKRKKRVATNEGLQIPLPEKIASSLEGIGKGKKKEHDLERFASEEGGINTAGEVRWLRVNTLKWTVETAVEWLEKGGWGMFEEVDEMLAAAQSQPRVFALDAHIEPLLAFPSSLVLTTLSAYQDGRLIAQDKASCMPAWVLLAPILADLEDAAERGESEEEKEKKGKKNLLKVLDATAAPGNKTTMAAAMLGNEGKVIACERDQGRFKVLKDMCKKADATNVQPMNVDFLSLNPEDPKFKNVTHILVDPSCSGSGIPSRLDHLVPSVPDAENLLRVKALSNFQLAILSHALRFSGAKRVVYSTCSIWEQEDEGVVMRILGKKELRQMGWRLESRDQVLPTWERRGRVEACGGDQNIANSVARALPEDGTNGFFVACFVKEDSESAVSAESLAAVERAQEKWNKEAQENVEAEEGGDLQVVEEGEGAEEQPALPVTSNSTASNGKKGTKKTKTPGTVVRPKDEVLGNDKSKSMKQQPKSNAKVESDKNGQESKEGGGAKLTKKQLYLMKKAELQQKKEKASKSD